MLVWVTTVITLSHTTLSLISEIILEMILAIIKQLFAHLDVFLSRNVTGNVNVLSNVEYITQN